MFRHKWFVVVLVALSTAAYAARRPPNPKPQSGRWLNQKDGLWYLLQLPKPYDADAKYPLLVVTPYRDDFASQAFGQWLPTAKLDQIFLATLNFQPGTKVDRTKSLWEMVHAVCKQYPNIDRRSLMVLGVEGGANAILSFVATYPRVFDLAMAFNPTAYPDITKVKPTGPRLASSNTTVYLTFDPKNKTLFPKLAEAIKQFRRRGTRIKHTRATLQGSGIPSPEEEKLALKLLRANYSSAKRKQLAAVWQKQADERRKQKEAEALKIAKARAELEGKPLPGAKKPEEVAKEEAADPDTLWLKANEFQNEKKDYAAAIEVYHKLIEIAPKSDYAREAAKRIGTLKKDPSVRRSIADAGAGTECKRWLSLAKNFMRAGRNDKAIAELNRVVAKYPDSSFAAEARKHLGKLKEGN